MTQQEETSSGPMGQSAHLVATPDAVNRIKRIQQDLQQGRCPLCRGKAKLQTAEREIHANYPVVGVKVFKKRFTLVECKRCGTAIYPFSAKSKVKGALELIDRKLAESE